jgi:hypothetical protein
VAGGDLMPKGLIDWKEQVVPELFRFSLIRSTNLQSLSLQDSAVGLVGFASNMNESVAVGSLVHSIIAQDVLKIQDESLKSHVINLGLSIDQAINDAQSFEKKFSEIIEAVEDLKETTSLMLQKKQKKDNWPIIIGNLQRVMRYVMKDLNHQLRKSLKAAFDNNLQLFNMTQKSIPMRVLNANAIFDNMILSLEVSRSVNDWNLQSIEEIRNEFVLLRVEVKRICSS